MDRKPFFSTFRLAFLAGVIYFCSTGCVLATATIANPLMLADADLHLNATLLSAGFSIFVLCQGIPGPLIGTLIARKGSRFAMTLGAIIMIGGAAAMALIVSEPWQYLICFGVLMSVGSVMAGQLSCQNFVGEWFFENRGRAMTIMMLIGGSGAIFVPPLVHLLVGMTESWQIAWGFVAVCAMLVIPLVFFFVHDRKKSEDLGMEEGKSPYEEGKNVVTEASEADGSAAAKPPVQCTAVQRVYKTTDRIPFKRVLRMPAFWLIALAGTGGYAAYTLAVSEGVLHFSALGFAQESIVGAVSCMGALGLVGTLGIGALSDRVEPVRLIGGCLVALIVGIVVAAFASNIFMVYFYYAITGLAFGAVSVTFPTAIANYFGQTAQARNLGTGLLVTTLVASTIPIFSGAIFDAGGSLSTGYLITAGIVLVCALCAFAVRFPKRK